MSKVESDLEQILATTPFAEWEVDQVIVFDWYDIPREGVCELKHPQSSFYFKILAENTSADDDTALYTLSHVPLGTVQQAASLLAALGESKAPVWIPRWEFPNQTERLQKEQKINHMIESSILTRLIICTSDMINFTGCWRR